MYQEGGMLIYAQCQLCCNVLRDDTNKLIKTWTLIKFTLTSWQGWQVQQQCSSLPEQQTAWRC